MQMSRKITYFTTLPKPTENMSRVIMTKVRQLDLAKDINPVAFVAQGFNLQELRLKEDYMYKDIFIMDFESVPLSVVLNVTPTFLQKIYTLYGKVYSMRLEALYIINSFPAVERLVSIAKVFVKQKLFERIHVCADASILQSFPKVMVPKDYGGEEKSLEELQEIQNRKLAEYRSRFNELDNMEVNEAQRPEPLKNDELLGFYGSFKTFDLD